MTLPELPVFNIPENLDHKKLPPDVIQTWMAENLRHLKESGQMERIRQQKSRQPVEAWFVL
ncbi:MAG: hypothetical protein PF904_02920 [Kiritimatiellae bacterium]|jgi:hypothetical protein|nr:hypothetical protein [Kiritimatiellia bacterium]